MTVGRTSTRKNRSELMEIDNSVEVTEMTRSKANCHGQKSTQTDTKRNQEIYDGKRNRQDTVSVRTVSTKISIDNEAIHDGNNNFHSIEGNKEENTVGYSSMIDMMEINEPNKRNGVIPKQITNDGVKIKEELLQATTNEYYKDKCEEDTSSTTTMSREDTGSDSAFDKHTRHSRQSGSQDTNDTETKGASSTSVKGKEDEDRTWINTRNRKKPNKTNQSLDGIDQKAGQFSNSSIQQKCTNTDNTTQNMSDETGNETDSEMSDASSMDVNSLSDISTEDRSSVRTMERIVPANGNIMYKRKAHDTETKLRHKRLQTKPIIPYLTTQNNISQNENGMNTNSIKEMVPNDGNKDTFSKRDRDGTEATKLNDEFPGMMGFRDGGLQEKNIKSKVSNMKTSTQTESDEEWQQIAKDIKSFRKTDKPRPPSTSVEGIGKSANGTTNKSVHFMVKIR